MNEKETKNNYIRKISNKPDFEEKNYFKGYFLNTNRQDVGIDYIEMENGHKYFQVETKSIRIYYILDGKGIACINERIYDIEQGDIIEIPTNTEFAFKGKLKMIEIMNPPFDINSHNDTRKNDL